MPKSSLRHSTNHTGLALLLAIFVPTASLAQSQTTLEKDSPAAQSSPQGPASAEDPGPYVKDLSAGNWMYVQVHSFLGRGVVPDGPYEAMTDRTRWKLYVKETYETPAAYIMPWLLVLPEQATNYPPEWTGFKGYALRAGARFIGETAYRTVMYPMHNLMNTEPRYIPCRCKGGFWKRLGHSIKYYYLTRTAGRKTVPDLPRIFGTYTGQFVAQAMYPGGYDAWRAARRATGTLLWGWWLNALREFRPEITRKLAR